MKLLDGRLRGGEIRRGLAGGVADVVRTSATTPLTAAPACGFSAVSRARTVAEAFSSSTRKCAAAGPALADKDGKIAVLGRASHQSTEAKIGKSGADVVDDRMQDLAVAAFHECVGHGFAQLPALRNREQMPLALAAGVGHQR